MEAFEKKFILALGTLLGVLGLTAHAAPTVSSVSVSGYLKRASGSVVSNGTYASSIALSSGGVALSGCSDTTDTVVLSGYFSKQIACPAATMAAGTAGNITAGVSLTIGGTPESFTVTAYPVPTALVAGTSLTVEDNSINNLKIAGTAAIALSKLNTTGATSGDVIRFDGTNWAYTGLGSLNIATTNSNNNYTVPQNFSGGANIGNATIGVSNTTTSTIGNLSVTSGVGITGGLAVGGSQTVGGYLAVTGAGTFGALHVTGDTTASNISASGYVSGANGTIANLNATNLTATGYVTAAAGTIANATLTGVTTAVNVGATGYVSGSAGTISTLSAASVTATGAGTFGGGMTVSGSGTVFVTTSDTTANAIKLETTGAGGGVAVDTSAGNGAFSVNTGTGTTFIANTATGSLAIALRAEGANAGIRLTAATVAIAPTGKMLLGGNGNATLISSIGTCSFTAAVATTQSFTSCPGLPATNTMAISCSPTANSSAASGIIFRGTGTVGSIGIRGTAAVTSQAWNCMWVQP